MIALLGTSAADQLPEADAAVPATPAELPTAEPAMAELAPDAPVGEALADPDGDDPYEMAASLLWGRALGVPAVGAHDEVTGPGRGQAAAERLAAILRDEFGFVVPVADVAAARTPAGLATLLAAHQGDADRHPTVVPLTGTGAGTPLFCFAEAGAPAIALLPFARHFAGERRVYGLQAHALERRGLPDWSVPAAARRHVADIRLLQPTGPYLLAGHSFGGLIALEVARMLRQAGHEVALLAMIDTYLPGTARLTRSGAIIPTSQIEGCHPDRPGDVPGPDGRGPLAANDGPSLGPRVLADRLRQLVELPLTGLVRFRGTHRYEAFHNQGRILTMTYRPHTYAGRTVVWLADDHDEIEGWRGVLTGPAAIHRILADHRTVLRQPLLTEIAGGLRAELAALADGGIVGA
ncbi:Thioesterase of type I polyketide synthase or non-ribosomal peptide synthase like protein [Frankia canadensis]|uniref:Thioesterase of type I polyketide synthase or non-ribosomal peptide synthase like protein n=1 Tax=Frankia canadensis TaxID=1836972 RepID=A0A2I2KTI0_9ACTN|nr:thioesterase domain-containing protein [Frankia canadensis]SNQ48949.1 Thioesterase of type I polyketide synthase or non-ribosomal peptide synthase like protein [Frankia canadensis]SOU56239.1 Thioesterase of type I polyketide synthase or non-ribosomal peptide synthase like protein [Frankia canadensis]